MGNCHWHLFMHVKIYRKNAFVGNVWPANSALLNYVSTHCIQTVKNMYNTFPSRYLAAVKNDKTECSSGADSAMGRENGRSTWEKEGQVPRIDGRVQTAEVEDLKPPCGGWQWGFAGQSLWRAFSILGITGMARRLSQISVSKQRQPLNGCVRGEQRWTAKPVLGQDWLPWSAHIPKKKVYTFMFIFSRYLIYLTTPKYHYHTYVFAYQLFR